MVKIAASILSANFAKLGEEVSEVSKAGADIIHLDIMDGHFVPNLTFGPDLVKAIRSFSTAMFEAHLMVENPHNYIEAFYEAGVETIIIHYESENLVLLKEILVKIRLFKINAGISIKPETPASVLNELLPLVDVILVMSVNPGFAGQEFMFDQCDKISEIHSLITSSGFKIQLSVDGGINEKNAKICTKAGANILIAGSYIFSGDYMQRIKNLRSSD